MKKISVDKKKENHEEEELHSDSHLMIPPPGFKFIPRFETICGKPGCFECFDIYCERCESKDRRIVELELRNNDLVKYITQIQGRLFGRDLMQQPKKKDDSTNIPFQNASPINNLPVDTVYKNSNQQTATLGALGQDPFAYIQSPVLYDPQMNLSYIATTTFKPISNQDTIVPFGK